MLTIAKVFSGCGGFIILAIGLMMLSATIWAFTNASFAFNQYTFLGILLAADLVIIFAAALGIIGIKKQNGALICIFQIFVMLFFFVFLGFGIAAKVLPSTVFNGNCTNSDYQLINIAKDSYLFSNQLCSINCKCGLTDDTINNGGFNLVEQAALKLLNRGDGATVNFQGCPVAGEYNSTYHDVFNVISSVEYSLDCSGWCQNDLARIFYKFSDVNRGKPAVSGCYDVMKDRLSEYGSILAIFAFSSAGFLLLICLCGLAVCCSPEKNKLPYSSRFVVSDNGYYRAN